MDGMLGYRRADGRWGIRNHVLVVYTVKCAELVARRIHEAVDGTQLIGHDSCYPDPYSYRVVAELAKHPNVGGVLFVQLGCESTPVEHWLNETKAAGKPAALVIIQRTGGTEGAIREGISQARQLCQQAGQASPEPISWKELTVGIECGGSDATSGLAANPAVGYAADRIIQAGGSCIFSELPELLGTDQYLLDKAETPQVRQAIQDGLRRARGLSNRLKTFAVSAGNENSGLTTIEEKSLGALCKAGSSPIRGVLHTGQRPDSSGLYLLDKVGDIDSNQLSVYEENDNDGFAALLACGAQLILFTTGCGNVVGNAVAPVLKICGNPRQTACMGDDFDVDASGIVQGRETIPQVGERVVERVRAVCGGAPARAEVYGHEEFYIARKFSRACDVTYLDGAKGDGSHGTV